MSGLNVGIIFIHALSPSPSSLILATNQTTKPIFYIAKQVFLFPHELGGKGPETSTYEDCGDNPSCEENPKEQL